MSLTSTETVHVFIESVPGVVSLFIESDSSATSTVLTFMGFEPDTTYYRYQDGDLMEEFTTDQSGGYTYTQDISENHYTFIQEEKATIYIRSNGDVDPVTAPISVDGDVYTFTDNIYETIIVQCNDITIDGQADKGYKLISNGGGYAIGFNYL